jgi:hypothetical protein
MKEHFDKVRINLVGIGYMIQKSIVSQSLFNEMFLVANNLNTTLNEALLDAEFFSILGLPELKSITDLRSEYCYFGLLDDPRSRIEIWRNGKKKKVLDVRQLYCEDLLFPLYNTEVVKVQLSQVSKNEIIFVEVSIGTVLDVSVSMPHFSVDKLFFKICEVENGTRHRILFDVLYEGKTLFVRLPETLVTNFSVFLEP